MSSFYICGRFLPLTLPSFVASLLSCVGMKVLYTCALSRCPFTWLTRDEGGSVLVWSHSGLVPHGCGLGRKAFAVLTKPFVSIFQLEKYFYEKQLLITTEKSERRSEQNRAGWWLEALSGSWVWFGELFKMHFLKWQFCEGTDRGENEQTSFHNI